MIIAVNKERTAEAIREIGAHPVSIPIFENKAAIEPLKLLQVRTPAANVIKQEMLGVGGDAVTPVGCIVNKDKYVDVLLLGTRKHYRLLAAKLAQMNFFGMVELGREIERYLAPQRLVTRLADGRVLSYEKMRVMGILNATPDSFYGGSRLATVEAALKKAEQMLAEGAVILDIGGESTRPGSEAVGIVEECQRVVPVIEAIRKRFPEAILSIDTWHAQTAKAALASGADILNDVTALEGDKDMAGVLEQFKAPVMLMHMRGTPKNMQSQCDYKNVVDEVACYLAERAAFAESLGLTKEGIILDPGIGFAKTVEQNLLLMRDLKALTSFGYPVLLAASRKSTIGAVLGNIPAEERLEGTLAASLQAVYAGAQLVRVHDVKENVRAIRMLEAILK